ncbi:alpha-L-fucosidase [Pedobacter jejuensis]|uniref:alpha-L-fucosidase n=1 Tax=Pedobacter jejuensis TaxID=1268550 RepID=A0A3N0BR53_9SPHI|nr:alpha-L-fucosidase [Pedobacter jejuensis]RNL51102.1 alpha-L-fucosidase [Pedobacter jejuensis]
MRILKLLLSILILTQSTNIFAQKTPAINQKMQWFADAKLGIFIHWGIYSVNGISESWAFYNNYINHDAYMKQLNGFTAEKYNPQEWVNLIKESGAKYAVITTKHHDGVSLWDTKAAKATTAINNSAAKKDLISPFVEDLKKAGLKTGLYFSLPDWSYPDYDIFTRDRKRYDFKAEPKRWNNFLNYYQTQLKELSTQYKPDLVWFDGDWEHTAKEWQTDKVRAILKNNNPNIIINSRLDENGDYETPEQGVPVVKPESKYWELCYTMNDSWGYQPYDNHYKSSNMIIRTLVDCISMGGNLLLDIGPKADGTIAPQQVKILKDLGRWTKKHAEAIYETQAGIPSTHFVGKTSLSKNKDVLYLYIDYKTANGLLLSGIKSKINKVEIVGNKAPVKIVKLNETDYLLDLNESAFDNDVTVLKVSLNEPIELSDEKLKSISMETLFSSKEESTPINLRKLAADLNNGINLFQSTNLVADGLGFKSGVENGNQDINDWVIKHAEALYKTTTGIPAGHYQGKTVLSADKQTLYLFVEGKPTGPIAIKGLKNNISRIRIVGEGTMLPHEIYNKLYWSKIPGIVYIPVPEDKLDKQLTIIAVLLDAPIDLYREKVGAIESNM